MEGVKHSIDHGAPISRMTFYINRVSLCFCFMEYSVIMSFFIRTMVFVYLEEHNYAVLRNFSEPYTARI